MKSTARYARNAEGGVMESKVWHDASIDKRAWGDGPWLDEPDLAQFGYQR
jgi:hypothetical protein